MSVERLIWSDVGVNCNQCLVMGCLMHRKPFHSFPIKKKCFAKGEVSVARVQPCFTALKGVGWGGVGGWLGWIETVKM